MNSVARVRCAITPAPAQSESVKAKAKNSSSQSRPTKSGAPLKTKDDEFQTIEAKMQTKGAVEKRQQGINFGDFARTSEFGARSMIETVGEEDLANLFAPMVVQGMMRKKTKAKATTKQLKPISMAIKQAKEINENKTTKTKTSAMSTTTTTTTTTKKSEYQAFVDYYSMEYQEYEQMPDKAFEKMRKNLSLDLKHRPMLTYMVSLGFKEKDLEKLLLQSEDQLFSKPVSKIITRVDYLKSELGLEGTSLVKIVSKDPQILLQRNRHSIPRCRYLTHLGLDSQALASVLSKQPSILHLSIQNSLKPRVDYLRHELGIASEDLAKVITRNPAVLTFSVEDQIAPRVEFLKGLGISHDNVAKLILRHPQTLQYSFEGIKEHVDFLSKECKMNEDEVAKTISRLNTFFSLSLDDNLRPKYEYLIEELGGTKQTAISFPAYWSLALDSRIKPRHRFMEEHNAAPDPFPMKLLAEKDEVFVKRVKGVNLDAFEAFKKDNVESYIAETQRKVMRNKVDHLRGSEEEGQSCAWPNPQMVRPQRTLSDRAMRSRETFRNIRSGTQHRGAGAR